MRYYELMMVVSPQVDDEGLAAALDRVNRYVSDRGGSVVRQEQWGRLRRLAYPIRNFNEGNYVLTHLEMDPQDTRELEASLHLSEDVLRHLLIRIDAIPPAPAPKAEPVEAAAEATETPTEAAQTEIASGDSQPAPAAEAAEAAAGATEPEATTEPSEAESAAAEATADVTEPEATTEPAEAESAAAEATADVTEPEGSVENTEAEVETEQADASSEVAEEPTADEPSTGEAQGEASAGPR